MQEHTSIGIIVAVPHDVSTRLVRLAKDLMSGSITLSTQKPNFKRVEREVQRRHRSLTAELACCTSALVSGPPSDSIVSIPCGPSPVWTSMNITGSAAAPAIDAVSSA